jgi:hypothetical protein
MKLLGIFGNNYVIFAILMNVETSECHPHWHLHLAGRKDRLEEIAGTATAVAGLSRGCIKYSTLHILY